MNNLLNNKKQWGDYDEYEELNIIQNSNLNEINKNLCEIDHTVSENSIDSNTKNNQINQLKPNKYNKKDVLGGK